ncbi:Hypothetical predicted protein [Mytilus galloprovincialis]|uniref:PiggyBac transposable element-derived protein domain-containing protein n=1 Tax=Mytilus galloprovincialis TaxID=29158 RepID=A0A8B6FLI1_MYTGA|nr:Hypothetical predicted protein [Mytilus galloprovincialis]
MHISYSHSDFDDYEEPYTDEGMSEEEEDYLDYLLGDNEEEMNDFDDPWIPADTYIFFMSFLTDLHNHQLKVVQVHVPSIVPGSTGKMKTAMMMGLQIQEQYSLNQTRNQAYNLEDCLDNKLTRVEPIIEHVRNISRELFQPYEKIAVDERIVKSKHKWSGIRQFMKDKPVKFWIKLWVLADTITGYTYKKVYTIGAVRGNSTAKPSVFKKNDGWEKLAGRGDFRWHRESRFLTVQWKDCKVVTIVSPIHTGSKVSGCTRTFQARTGWKKQVVKQPECIKSYNDGMFGVDKSNQYLSRHRCYIKTKFHWWKVLFFHCLDMMVVNSFILFQEFRTEFPNKFESIPAHFGQLEFRESLVRSLLDVGSLEKKHESFACTPSFNENSNRLRCTFCYAHAKMYSLPVQHNKTVFCCEKCSVCLCLVPERNCFKKWHSVEGKPVRNWVKENGRKKNQLL